MDVASQNGKAVDGVFSERDVVAGLADHGNDLLDMKVKDLMTRSDPEFWRMIESCRKASKTIPAGEVRKRLGIPKKPQSKGPGVRARPANDAPTTSARASAERCSLRSKSCTTAGALRSRSAKRTRTR